MTYLLSPAVSLLLRALPVACLPSSRLLQAPIPVRVDFFRLPSSPSPPPGDRSCHTRPAAHTLFCPVCLQLPTIAPTLQPTRPTASPSVSPSVPPTTPPTLTPTQVGIEPLPSFLPSHPSHATVG